MTAYLFVGPTLSAADARSVMPSVQVLPPVALGDVYRVALRRPLVIGIVDGYFERRPAVYHKEILWALDQGIHVVGASSMGALRAAELGLFGMEGVGQIYRSFADGTLMADDEVAVAHATEEDAYRQMSEALVNIRATVAHAVDDATLTSTTASLVVDAARALYYPDRVWPEILAGAAGLGAPNEELERLRYWLPGNVVNQKRDDALELVDRMAEIVGQGIAKQVEFHFSNTTFWATVRASIDVQSDPSAAQTATVDQVLEELRLRPADYELAKERARFRYVALSLADQFSVVPEMSAVLEEGLQLRRAQGLHGAGELDEWQHANDLGDDELLRLLGEESRIRWVAGAADPALRSYLVDYLRLSGQFVALAERAKDKRAALSAVGLDYPTFDTAQVCQDDVIAWFRRRMGDRNFANAGSADRDVDFDTLADDLGFAGRPELLRALLREYLYSTPG